MSSMFPVPPKRFHKCLWHDNRMTVEDIDPTNLVILAVADSGSAASVQSATIDMQGTEIFIDVQAASAEVLDLGKLPVFPNNVTISELTLLKNVKKGYDPKYLLLCENTTVGGVVNLATYEYIPIYQSEATSPPSGPADSISSVEQLILEWPFRTRADKAQERRDTKGPDWLNDGGLPE